MTSASSLIPIATWFLLNMARIVATSTIAEHRIDSPAPGYALGMSRAARADRLNAANYDARGQELLPWYRAINLSYWTVVAGLLLWAADHF